jgi:phosphatidylglycerol:prolipoprotein diacylglycerol transferase
MVQHLSRSTDLPFPNIDPVAFSLGPFSVRWYALAYLAGVALGALYGMSLLKRKSLWRDNTPPFDTSTLLDFAFWAVIGIVVGGRTGYVLFYNLSYYMGHPAEILALWDGGMSFHGGLIGIILAMIFFARSRHANVLSALDLIAAVGPIGLFLGRLANFINGELYGAPTTLPWAVVFPTDPEGLPRHPSQLYEAALEGIVLFIVLRLMTHVFYALRRPGLVAAVFGIGYSLARIVVEFVRLPDVQIGYLYGGWLTMGQVLSLPTLIAGLIILVYAATRPRSGRP